jgi:hypothetical protein
MGHSGKRNLLRLTGAPLRGPMLLLRLLVGAANSLVRSGSAARSWIYCEMHRTPPLFCDSHFISIQSEGLQPSPISTASILGSTGYSMPCQEARRKESERESDLNSKVRCGEGAIGSTEKQTSVIFCTER